MAFSPEPRGPEAQGLRHLVTIPKLVGGIDQESGQISHEMRASTRSRAWCWCRRRRWPRAAKLLENIFRAINIALVNEMKVVLTAMDIDIWEVVEAAKTKPFGFMAFYPGPGLGGHCIPIDPFYLTWKAREVGHATKFIELAGEINRGMPEYVVHRLMLALNKHGKAIGTSKVLVLGVAYKPDIDDLRESPSFELIEKFKDLGAEVDYNDPHIPETPKVRRHDLKLRSKDLSPEMLASYDAVVIATNHSDYDYALIGKHAKLIVDTRNAMKGFERRDHIVMA
ncbi:MAG: nucleotide sugar dehydrogenase [Phycisphaerales bacterium]